MPVASSLAAEIQAKFSVDAQLVESKGGCFEVTVDDQLVFSKNAVKRFPEEGEVVAAIEAL